MDISKWKDLWKLSVARISPKTLVAQPLIYLHGFSVDRSMINLSDLKNKSFSFAGMVGDQASSSSISYNSMLNFGSRLQVVQAIFSVYIFVDEEALDRENYFSKNGLVCRFNGLWQWLVDPYKSISKTWNPSRPKN